MATIVVDIDDLSPIQAPQKSKGQPGAPSDDSEDNNTQSGGGGGEGKEDDGGDESGSGGSPGEEDNSPDDEMDEVSPDDIHREIEEKLSKKTESNGKEEADPSQKDSNKSGEGPNQISKSGSGQGLRRIDKIPKPKFSWKELLRQFVQTSKATEPTYSKINKRTITAMTGVSALGAGAVKPGERPVDEAFKLAVIFDSSGSMMHKMPTSLAETENLVKEFHGSITGTIGVGLFGDIPPKYFALNLGTKKFWSIPTFGEINKPAPTNARPMQELFRLGGGGGYEFPDAGAAQVKTLLSQGYNVVLMTDTDITFGRNWENLIDVMKTNPRGFFLILDSERSFQHVVKQLGANPGNFGHF